MVMVTCPWNPPGQLLTTEYAAEHDAAPDEVGDGLGEGVRLGVGLGVGLGEEADPPRLTEKELVARPAPPCHSSKPASTSMRYHDFLI